MCHRSSKLKTSIHKNMVSLIHLGGGFQMVSTNIYWVSVRGGGRGGGGSFKHSQFSVIEALPFDQF